jgi:methyltransferase FkbM-like protein
MKNLIDYRRQCFSQNGEEDIIARVFDVIGAGNKFCCEFGAWDGIFLSNTRSLVLEGWSALLIEGDAERFVDLQANYIGKPNVTLECAFVDAGDNSLARILERRGLADRRLDLLSIDIDGLDFELFATLDQLRSLPRLVVVEVQPEHGFDWREMIPSDVARQNIGQPLAVFVQKARELGYRLVCYLGCNAFFLASDCGGHDALPTLSPDVAWTQCIQLHKQQTLNAEHLYRRNLGMADSLYRFNNPVLTADFLGISAERAARLVRQGRRWRLKRIIKDVLTRRT